VTIHGETDVLSTILWISVAAAVLFGLAGLVIGRILARRMLRPLNRFNSAARRAAEGGFDHRVALDGPRDEFTDLSDTFDQMLERLDRSFHSHQRFSADASHELRTPLSAMKTMLEVAERDPGTDLHALLSRLRQTNQRSIDTVEALLDLADLDHTVIDFRPVRLDEIVREVLVLCQAELVAHRLELSPELAMATVQGNAVLLRHLVTNLIQNAIRHNRARGTISVIVDEDRDAARLIVSNTGGQLDPATVAACTTPFFRAAGRAPGTVLRGSGSGLGLAVVSAIALAHHAEFRLDPNPPPDGGLSATLSVPRGNSLERSPIER